MKRPQDLSDATTPSQAGPKNAELDTVSGFDGALGARAVIDEFAPRLAAVAVFLGGLALLASAVQPALPDRLASLLSAWPVEFVDVSHLMASIIGVLLLLVAGGLWRRLDGAYWLTLLLLLAGAVFSLMKALDWEEATLLVLLALLLAPCRAGFYRHSRFTAGLFTGTWVVGVVVALAAAMWLMLVSYQHVDYRDDLWWALSGDADASRSLRALAASAVLGLLALVWSGLHPAVPKPSQEQQAADLERAKAIFENAEGAYGDANLIHIGDKSFVFTASGRSFVQYRQRGGHWIAMGDPVGPRNERIDAMLHFHAKADQASASPVVYAASADMLPALADLGYTVRKIGEVAAVDVAAFSLDGPQRARLRQVRSRLDRDGWRVTIVLPGEMSDWLGLQDVSQAWLARHKGSEKSFSLGRFDPAYLAHFPIAVVHKQDGRPVAFASLWPTPDKSHLAIDLMRHGEAAPGGVMDYLFLAVIDWAKEQGYAWFELGMTPLAGFTPSRYAPTLNKLGAAIYALGEKFYGFKGLRAYKAKFQPHWRSVFIAAPPPVSLPIALFDSAVLTSGGLRGLLGLR